MIQRIVIIRFSSIGDIILTTALLRSVRQKFPQAHITYIVKEQFVDIIKHNVNIDKILAYKKYEKEDNLSELVDQLSLQSIDWVIDIHNNLRSRLLRSKIRADKVTTYSKRKLIRTLLVMTGINLYTNRTLVMNRYFEAVEKMGIHYDDKGTEVYFLDEHMHYARQQLANQNIESHDLYVTICPAASYKNKMWRADGFAALADEIIEEFGFKIVLLGGPTDRGVCESVLGRMKHGAAIMTGTTNLLQSAAILKGSVAVVSNDSGMMHLSQSQKVPVVGVFGPTVQEFGFYPYGDLSKIVEVKLSCRPCTAQGMNNCPKGHWKCMNNITPTMVMVQLRKLIN